MAMVVKATAVVAVTLVSNGGPDSDNGSVAFIMQ
jgi:hypothetical protein